MPLNLITMGEMSNQEIAQKFRELDDEETASEYENSSNGLETSESLFNPAWRATGSQFGFIPVFKAGNRYQSIVSASTVKPENSLKGQAINIRLAWLHAYQYPRSRSDILTGTDHNLLFTAEARNQAANNAETVAFNQVYQVRGGQDAGIAGYPIFTGLNVGANGLSFTCGVISVSNEQDENILKAMDSSAVRAGLNLLKTMQPGLVPFSEVAINIAQTLGDPRRSRNRAVQKFALGLDFDEGIDGARLAIGSYLAVQVRRSGEIDWAEWQYDTQSRAVVSVEPNRRGNYDILPYNALMFTLSTYQEITS